MSSGCPRPSRSGARDEHPGLGLLRLPAHRHGLSHLASAKWGDVDSLQALLGFEEISYFVMFGYLAARGI